MAGHARTRSRSRSCGALGIADLNPANVLWDGERCRLVDFEDGGLSDPAYELADHVEHIASRLTGVYDAAALVDAVGLDEDARRADATPTARCGRPSGWPCCCRATAGGDANPPGTTEAQARHLLGLLDA